MWRSGGAARWGRSRPRTPRIPWRGNAPGNVRRTGGQGIAPRPRTSCGIIHAARHECVGSTQMFIVPATSRRCGGKRFVLFGARSRDERQEGNGPLEGCGCRRGKTFGGCALVGTVSPCPTRRAGASCSRGVPRPGRPGNPANPRSGTELQYARSRRVEEAVEVVRDHEGGTGRCVWHRSPSALFGGCGVDARRTDRRRGTNTTIPGKEELRIRGVPTRRRARRR